MSGCLSSTLGESAGVASLGLERIALSSDEPPSGYAFILALSPPRWRRRYRQLVTKLQG
jgi:hypothetical protein